MIITKERRKYHLFDVNEKEKQKMDSILTRLSDEGIRELQKIKGSEKELFSDSFHQQAIQMGFLSKPPSSFVSKYNILKEFLMSKRFEGCSSQTLKLYYDTLFNFLIQMEDKMSVFDIRTADVRSYLIKYQGEHKCSNTTMDNMRRVFSSFYNWLEDEDYTIKNPVKKIKRIKTDKIIKKPFSDEELEALKDACRNYRELALIEFLYSTGIRVGELCGLDISDLDFNQREGIVFGKGSKERIIYFDVKSKVHLIRYLNTRVDSNPALFVTKKYPFNRLEKSGVESILREIGNRAGIEKCHPHRFRRTFATNLLDRGVPIEQVQVLLGHSKIDTTLLYASVNTQSVKLNHNKYI